MKKNDNRGIFELFGCNKILLIFYFIMLFVSLWSNFSIYTICIFCAIAYVVIPLRRYIDKTAIFLFLFSSYYCLLLLFLGVGSWFKFVSYLLSPLIFYIYGKYIVDKLTSFQRLAVFLCISIFLFSMVLYVSAMQDIIQNGFVNVHREFYIWGINNNDESWSATLYGIIASLGLVGLPLVIVKNIGLIVKLVFLLLSILSLTTVIHLVNRTGIVVECICFFTVGIYILKEKKNRILELGILMLLIFIMLSNFLCIDSDIFEAYSHRNEGSIDGERFDRWIDGMQNFIKYPLGWVLESTQYNYVHNLWLDIARVSGFIPFIFFLVATLLSYRDFFKLLHSNDMMIIPVLLGINVCFFLTSMVEPIIEAVPLYFYLYLMIWGIQNRILSRLNVKNMR